MWLTAVPFSYLVPDDSTSQVTNTSFSTGKHFYSQMIQPCHLKRLQRSYKEPFSSNAVFDDENYIITSTQMMQIIGNKTNTQTHSFLSLKNSRSETEGSIQQKSSVPNQFPAINENNKRIRKLNNWSSLLISAAITKKKSTLHSSNPPILCLWN